MSLTPPPLGPPGCEPVETCRDRGRVIELECVSKRYGAAARRPAALDRVSARIGRGECVAVVGPNGAGKTTLMGLLAGFLSPSDGVLRIDGLGPRAFARQRGFGYVPERPVLPSRWRVSPFLLRLGCLDGLSGRRLALRVASAIEVLGLGAVRDAPVGSLSCGTLQRVAIAQLFLNPRQLVLLDEPLTGLDPIWRRRFRGLLMRLRDGDRRTIVVASHDLDEVARLVDRVLVLGAGRLHAEASASAGVAALERLVEEAAGSGVTSS